VKQAYLKLYAAATTGSGVLTASTWTLVQQPLSDAAAAAGDLAKLP